MKKLLAVAHEYDVAGAPRTRSAELFEEVAEIQDEVALRMGLHNLGFRVIGTPYWGDNLGHLAMLNVFVKLKSLGQLSPEARVMGFQHPANEHYLAYWQQHLPRLTMSRSELSAFNLAVIPLQECTSFLRTTSGIQDLYQAWLNVERAWIGRPPVLQLKTEDWEWGRSQLKAMGVDPDRWFVALHVRSGDSRRSKLGRNADIKSYMTAADRVVAAGGTVIRLGNPLMPRLPAREGLIDYAHSSLRSQRLDVFLLAAGRFFIGTNSGPMCAASTFGVPILATNWPTLGYFPFAHKTLMIPKMYLEKDTGRALTLTEVMASPSGWSEDPNICPNVTELDNSAEDILDAVTEMLEVTRHESPAGWPLTLDQERAQQIVHSQSTLNGATFAQSFLDSHPGWL